MSQIVMGFLGLMRMAPLLLCVDDQRQMIEDNTMVTHAHKRSLLGSIMYVDILEDLPDIGSMESTLQRMFVIETTTKEYRFYSQFKEKDFKNIPESNIKSTGYVVDTLLASIWCILNTNSYKEAVLKAVNLGGDTDTIAAITGSFAGAIYGYDNIPREWIDALQNKQLIDDLMDRVKL